MNKKTTYWIVGILAAILVLLLVWASAAGFMGGKDSSDGQNPGMDHAGMDHSSMGQGQSSVSSQDEALANYLNEQDTIMSNMMRDMEGIEKTGSAAVDFLAGMIPHHESAIAMAQSYLKAGGNDPTLRTLAENVIDTQTQEIGQMKSMIEDRKASGETDQEKADAYWKEYEKMLSSHHTGHSSSATNLDAAFAEGMTMHHQMAVDMSNAILNHTSDEEVRTLANAIIDAQQEEISQMQDVLDRLQSA